MARDLPRGVSMKLLFLCAALLFAQVAHAADADPALVAAAQKEGQVVWYSTLIVNQILRPLAEAFEKKYPGIRMQYSRATNSDTALKIINESRARRLQADMFEAPTRSIRCSMRSWWRRIRRRRPRRIPLRSRIRAATGRR
jgi:ABC-type glycerol-3-phosphate transport system substrate-binding protein